MSAGDYDREPFSGPSQYLRLKSKDESATFRIASAPYREPKVWKDGQQKPLEDAEAARLTESQWMAIKRDPLFNVSEVFSWLVIDRDSGQAKIYSGTPGVYKKIKAYAEMPEWGDPSQYDLKVTRTEEPGSNYYDVMALPIKTSITQTEAEAVSALAGQLDKLMPNARLSNAPQIDDISEQTLKGPKADPAQTEKTDDDPGNVMAQAGTQGTDTVIEDIGDEPINLDDIPF